MSLVSTSGFPKPSANRTGWPWTVETPASVYDSRLQWPRVSIVTPSFNQGEFVEETIRSVLLQNYPNLEFIIMDGGSTDESVEIIQKYAKWLHHWESGPDQGQSDAVNRGLKLASGVWVNWLNSDDTFLPGALAAMTDTGQKTENTSIVSGRTKNTRNGEFFGEYGAQFIPTTPDCFFKLGVNQPGSLLRRKHVESVGALRPELHLCMDLDLWQRLMLNRGVNCHVSIDQPVATYRYHEQSKTCSSDDTFALEEFTLLHDLALAAGSQIPAKLARIRRLSSLAPLSFQQLDSLNDRSVDRAFVDRLLASDNLLFRAILRSNQTRKIIESLFLEALDELIPIAAQLLQVSASPLQIRALISAQQSWGRFNWAFQLRAFKLEPSLATVREGLRILKRSWLP